MKSQREVSRERGMRLAEAQMRRRYRGKVQGRTWQPALDPVEILTTLADSFSRAQDAAFWILVSAAAYLNGHCDNEGSTVATYFPDFQAAWEQREREANARRRARGQEEIRP